MTIYKLTDFNGNSKSLYKPNLLINGDFKVNQRGQTSYSSTGYTLDMWRTVNASVAIGDDGIIVSSQDQTGYFNQKMKLSDGSYTSVLNVEIISGSASHYADGATIENGKLATGINVFRADGALTQYGIRLEPNSSVKIKYADLFEGDIAYAHVKEDEATALMRCQHYVLAIPQVSIARYSYRAGISYFSGFVFPVKMASKPNITGTYITSDTQTIDISIDFNSRGIMYSYAQIDAIGLDMRNVIISCEP